MTAGTLAVTEGRVWDGTGAAAFEGATVLIEEGRITAVGADLEVPPGIERVDAAGRFVMPGLIDSHVHVLLSGEDESLPAFLGAGITSVRDVGGTPDEMLRLREQVASGALVGPRIFTYGPLLDGDPTIFPGGAGMDSILHTGALKTPEEGAAAVRDLIERGVDGIKLYAGLRPDLVRAMVEAADGRVPVTGHLGRTWASEAAEAGINCLEHVHATCYQDIARPEDRHTREGGNGSMPNYWTWLNEGWARADLDAPYVQEFIAQLVEREVALSPTTVLVTNGIATTDSMQEPGLRYLPRKMGVRIEERNERMRRMREAAEKAGRPMPARDPETGASARAQEMEFLRRFHAAGGRLAPSTDCGSHTGLVPGFSLLHELEVLVEAGISASDVLQGATRVAAEVLWRGDELGTLEAGKRADLLVLDGDPLEDIANVRTARTVVKDGVAHEASDLLASVPAASQAGS